MKLRCWLGFHKWPQHSGYQVCMQEGCNKTRMLVQIIFEDDARKMGVSEEAIARGSFTKEDILPTPPKSKDGET